MNTTDQYSGVRGQLLIPKFELRTLRPYSLLKDVRGSTAAARRAGTNVAASVTAASRASVLA
jgi:hypothetical protein